MMKLYIYTQSDKTLYLLH